ncbi:MAG: phosphatase PAP2/dual specificity phosphatase family protein [Alsobacter sp.]
MTSLAAQWSSRRPWRRAALWLACLAPLFYATYGFSNWMASLRPDVPSVVFDWERSIPFIGWTILPYWSINAFYGASLFVCTDRKELDTHGRRLLTAQLLCIACFLLVPLRFSFPRPDTGGGVPGFLFDALLSFDKPYNQAPSLHIALLVILWDLYARHTGGVARRLLDAWFLLIGASVLTTYQHHFIDIPTGALAGLVCLWIWPWQGRSPLAGFRLRRENAPLASLYAAGAAGFAVAGWATGGLGLWLFWPAVALALVAGNYALFGAQGFQKDASGQVTPASMWLLAPSRWGAWLNSRLWTRRDPRPVAVADGVWLGRMPGRRTAANFARLVDLSAELRPPRAASVTALPTLDLVPPSPDLLRNAALAIEAARRHGPVLVCCALGYSRSAAAVAAWLLATGRAPHAGEAARLVRAARPRVVLKAATLDAVALSRGDAP